MAGFDDVLLAIEHARARSPWCVVGISGFGGAGKSTLARRLVAEVPRSARIRGDDFIVPARADTRSDQWSAVERMRLRREVLDPFRFGHPSLFRRWDWASESLRAPEPLPDVEVLLVDAVGIFHPELDGVFDLLIWVDVDLATATARGKARDRAVGNDHDRLWDEVWRPNERDFAARFEPRCAADLLYEPRDRAA